MKRLNIYRGLVVAFALVLSVAWVCRHKVVLPDITEGRMFSVHEVCDHKGMLDVELHSLNDDRLLSGAGIGEADLGIFDDAGSAFGNRNQGEFSPSAPRVASSRKFKDDERDGGLGGLFGDNGRDAFSDINSAKDVGSWGWLADDIQTAERGSIKTERGFGEQREKRGFLGDDNDGFKRFDPNRSSSDNSFFQRQDLRW